MYASRVDPSALALVFHHRNSYTVTILQKPHALGSFGLTPNVLAQTSAKVVMATRFLGLVGFLPLEEHKLCLPNQLLHDPETYKSE